MRRSPRRVLRLLLLLAAPALLFAPSRPAAPTTTRSWSSLSRHHPSSPPSPCRKCRSASSAPDLLRSVLRRQRTHRPFRRVRGRRRPLRDDVLLSPRPVVRGAQLQRRHAASSRSSPTEKRSAPTPCAAAARSDDRSRHRVTLSGCPDSGHGVRAADVTSGCGTGRSHMTLLSWSYALRLLLVDGRAPIP